MESYLEACVLVGEESSLQNDQASSVSWLVEISMRVKVGRKRAKYKNVAA